LHPADASVAGSVSTAAESGDCCPRCQRGRLLAVETIPSEPGLGRPPPGWLSVRSHQ
jgi:hypothetical protein